MSDSIDFNQKEDPIKPAEKKDLTYKPSLYKKITDKYYSIIDKLHLRKITNVIDKVMPSMFFFLILFLVIIAIILFFALSGSGQTTYTLKVLAAGKPLEQSYSILLTSKDTIDVLTPTKNHKGTTRFNASKDARVNAKISVEGYVPVTRTIITNKKELSVNIKLIPVIKNKKPDVSNNIFSFALVSKNVILQKDAKLTVKCDKFNKEFEMKAGHLNNQKIPCNTVSVTANINDYPAVTQNCGPGLCKISVPDKLGAEPQIKKSLPKNKLIVSVNKSDDSPASGFEVSVREDAGGQKLIDSGTTNDFGSYNFDLLVGDYVVSVSDPSGVYASKQKDVTVTAGNANTLTITLNKPALGNINVSFKVDDSNVVSGSIFLKDVNSNILETKQYSSDKKISFPILEKGKYIISTSLDYQYSEDYVSKDMTVNYNKDSGDVDITQSIRKLNPQTDQNIVVQVLDATTNKPIPFAEVYFEDYSGKLVTNVGNQGFFQTDANGMMHAIFSVGSYTVKLRHDYLGGSAGFDVVESKSLTITTQKVFLNVQWGDVSINVCLKDEKGVVKDATLKVYSVERGLESTYIVDDDNGCISTRVKSLENVYFYVKKEGYFDLYSQTFFLINTDNPKEITLNLEHTIPVSPIEKLQSEFLGIYSDDTLKNKSPELQPMETYYYAFKVKVPNIHSESRRLRFYGVAGKQDDKNAIKSKLQVKLVNSFGATMYYNTYKKGFNDEDLDPATIGKDYCYEAKSFYNYHDINGVDNETEIIYVVMVTTTNNIDRKAPNGDNILFSYWFGFDKNLHLKTISKKVGQSTCKNPICMDVYHDGFPVSVPSQPINDGNTIGTIFARISFNKDYNLAVYNAPPKPNVDSKNVDSKDKLNNLYLTMNKNKSNYSVYDIYGDHNDYNYNIGPLYLDKQKVSDEGYIDTNIMYEILDNSSSLYFRVYNKDWKDSNDDDINYINFQMPSTHKLSVKGYPKYIVPYIKNKINLSISDDKSNNPVVNAKLKYYTESKGNWVLSSPKTFSSKNGGQISFNTPELGDGDKIKIVVSTNGYQNDVNILTADFNFLKIPGMGNDDKAEIDINYPKDRSPVLKSTNIYNDSGYDLNISNFKLFLDNSSNIDHEIVDALLDTNSMENYINKPSGSKLKANSDFNIYVYYYTKYLLSLSSDIRFKEVASFEYKPPDALTKKVLSKIDGVLSEFVPITFDFGFEGKPDNEDSCFNASLRVYDNQDTEISRDPDGNVHYLDGIEMNHAKLFVENECKSEDIKLDLAKVELSLESSESKSGNLKITGVNETDQSDTFTLNAGSSDTVQLNGAIKQGFSYYDLNFTLPPNFDQETDTFKITPYYKSSYARKHAVKLDSQPEVTLKVINNNLRDCLKVSISGGDSNDDFKTGIPGTKNFGGGFQDQKGRYYFRMPYEYKPYSQTMPETYMAISSAQHSNICDHDLTGDDFNYDVKPSPANLEQDGYYKHPNLPLVITNKCGMDLDVNIKPFKNSPISDLQIIKSINYANGSGTFIIPDGKKKAYTIYRPEKESGAAILELDVKNKNIEKYEPINYILINVQSTKNNLWFSQNPFLNGKPGNTQVPVFYNQFFSVGPVNMPKEAQGFSISSSSGTLSLFEFLQRLEKSTWYSDIWQFLLPDIKGFIRRNTYKISLCDGWGGFKFCPLSGDPVPSLRILGVKSGIWSDVNNILEQFSLNSENNDFMGLSDIFRIIEKKICTNDDTQPIGYIIAAKTGAAVDSSSNNITAKCASDYVPTYIVPTVDNHEFVCLDRFFFTENDDNVYTVSSPGENPGGETTEVGYVLYCRLKDSEIEAFNGTSTDFKINRPFINYKFHKEMLLENTNFNGSDSEVLYNQDNVIPEGDYITVHFFDLNSLPDLNGFSKSLQNCDGGFTGKEYAPKVDYSNKDKDTSCIITKKNLDPDACSLKQFANVLTKQIKQMKKNNNNNLTFNVRLMADSYSKDNLAKIAASDFLTNTQEYNILTPESDPVGELSPGDYFVKILKNKDGNYNIFLTWQTMFLPYHLFYYMPNDGVSVDNYGASVSSPINFRDGDPVPASGGDDTSVGLYRYTVQTKNFEELNGDDYGLILSGNPTKEVLYYDPHLSIVDVNFSLKSNETKIISAKLVNKGLSVSSDILAQHWFVKKKDGNLYYPETVGVDITKKGNDTIEIKNTSNEEVTLKRIFFVPSGDKFSISPKDINSFTLPNKDEFGNLQSIINGVQKSKICYNDENGTYRYYYNISKENS